MNRAPQRRMAVRRLVRHGLVRSSALIAVACVTAGISFAATPDDCHTLVKHGRRAEAKTCFESLTQSRDPYIRAEGFWGLQVYDQANNEFRAAVAQAPNNAMYHVRWGRLLHERF